MNTKPRTILFQAAPFCFGPIATTLNIATELSREGHRLLMIGEGSTKNLLRRAQFGFDLVEASTALPFSSELCSLIDQADLVVSNTDPVFAAACMRRGARVVIVDTLFWMWDQLDPILFEADAFIVQDFLGTEKQLNRMACPRNLVLVGPLVRDQEIPIDRIERENYLLVSLGGCDCSLVDQCSDPYPEMVFRIVDRVVEETRLPIELRWATGERPASYLSGKFHSSRVKTYSNPDHIGIMRKARGVLLSPGITGSMEAFEAESPVFFLPPQNYSQVLQMKAFREKGAAPFGFSWYDLYPENEPPPYLPEEEAVKQVRETIEHCISEDLVQDLFCQSLRHFLLVGMDQYDPIPGKKLRYSLGTNGPEKAAKAILQLLCG